MYKAFPPQSNFTIVFIDRTEMGNHEKWTVNVMNLTELFWVKTEETFGNLSWEI